MRADDRADGRMADDLDPASSPPYRHLVVDQFMRGMKMMRQRDPQVQEDGFGLVRQVATEHVADLVAAYLDEEDPGLRCWLLELVGEARSPEALPILRDALTSPDEAIRSWARAGLQKLDSKDSRTLLWRNRNRAPS